MNPTLSYHTNSPISPIVTRIIIVRVCQILPKVCLRAAGRGSSVQKVRTWNGFRKYVRSRQFVHLTAYTSVDERPCSYSEFCGKSTWTCGKGSVETPCNGRVRHARRSFQVFYIQLYLSLMNNPFPLRRSLMCI